MRNLCYCNLPFLPSLFWYLGVSWFHFHFLYCLLPRACLMLLLNIMYLSPNFHLPQFNNAMWNLHCIPYLLYNHPFNIITGISYKSLSISVLFILSYSPIIENHQQNPSKSTYSSLYNAFPFTQKNSSFLLRSPIHGSCFVIFIIKLCRNKPTREKKFRMFCPAIKIQSLWSRTKAKAEEQSSLSCRRNNIKT